MLSLNSNIVFVILIEKQVGIRKINAPLKHLNRRKFAERERLKIEIAKDRDFERIDKYGGKTGKFIVLKAFKRSKLRYEKLMFGLD